MSAAQLDLFAEPTDSLDCVTPAEAEPVSRRVALCQDIDQLLSIEEYTYDLGNAAFLEYCINRGVLYVAGRPGSRMWEYFRDTALGLDDWLSDETVRYAQEYEGSRHRYADEDMRAHWRSVLIGRGKLQDCWDLWSGER